VFQDLVHPDTVERVVLEGKSLAIKEAIVSALKASGLSDLEPAWLHIYPNNL
jgi:hypothetical protein